MILAVIIIDYFVHSVCTNGHVFWIQSEKSTTNNKEEELQIPFK